MNIFTIFSNQMHATIASALYKKVLYLLIIAFAIIIVYLIQLCLSNIEARRKLIRDYDYEYNNISYEDYIEEKFQAMRTKVVSILRMKKMVKHFNEKQIIYNRDYFNPVNNGYIIVIQVHQNIVYFKELIDSLRHVVGINKCLLIFSHGYYDAEINNVVRNITFAKYMQIFYPYSHTLYPDIFPGNDKTYCKDGFMCEQSDGERDFIFAQKKNHWWWQMNHVFDNLEELQSFKNCILFLEENELVAADLIYMLAVVQRLIWENHEVDVISFGAYPPNITRYHLKDAVATIRTWTLKINYSGIAFNRTVWQIFKSANDHFCNFDDYRWSNSLLYAASKTSKGGITLLVSEGSRVFEIKERCDSNDLCVDEIAIENVKLFLKTIKRGLFPLKIKIIFAEEESNIITEGGGFGDVRDRELCKFFAKETQSNY